MDLFWVGGLLVMVIIDDDDDYDIYPDAGDENVIADIEFKKKAIHLGTFPPTKPFRHDTWYHTDLYHWFMMSHRIYSVIFVYVWLIMHEFIMTTK